MTVKTRTGEPNDGRRTSCTEAGMRCLDSSSRGWIYGPGLARLAGRAHSLPGMGAAGRLMVAADKNDECSGKDTW